MSDIDGLFPELSGILGAIDNAPPPAPLPTDEHGGVTDEQLEAFFTANPGIRPLNPEISGQQQTTAPFRSGSTGVPPVGGIEGDGTTLPPATPPPAPVTPPPAQPLTPPATPPLPASDPATQQLEALREALTSDPELRAKIADHFVGRAAPQVSQPPVAPVPQPSPIATPEPIVPAQQFVPSQPPPNLDMEDPSIAALWQMVQSQQQQLAATQQTVQAAHATTQAQVAQQMNSYYETASTHFATRYELEPTDIEHLSGVAARLGVLPQLMSGVDPMTGLPVRPDPIAAIDRALEIAYFSDDTYRQKEWARQATTRKSDAQRQQKLAAVSGSSGSVPRTTPAPTTEAGRKDAMLSEVGAMLNGSWSDPASN